MRKRILAFAACAVAVTLAHATTVEEDVRTVFDRYIAIQNAHDSTSMRNLLLDSPDFLWISRGKPVWGREAALKDFEERYKGTWFIEVDRKDLRVISVSRRVAQVYATTQLTAGDPGVEPTRTRLYINLVMVKKPEGWQIASILPISVPPGVTGRPLANAGGAGTAAPDTYRVGRRPVVAGAPRRYDGSQVGP